MLDPLIQNLPYLLRGAHQTIILALGCVTSGILAGIFLGTMSVIAPAWVRGLITIYVFVIRGIPVLVLMFIAYYAPGTFGLHIPDIYPVGAALALYGASYVTEIVRGSILAVPKGQIEAGTAIGLGTFQILLYILIPQAVRLSLPALVNNTVIMTKATAYVSLVGIWELTYAARETVERAMAPFEIFIGVLIIYFIICYPLSLLSRRLEKVYTYGESGFSPVKVNVPAA